MSVQHFLRFTDPGAAGLRRIVDRAAELKRDWTPDYQPLRGRTLAMIFSKSSTRTRVSFEAAMAHFGGSAIFLSPRDSQLGRGEPIADTARVVGSMCDAVMIRNDSQAELEVFAEHCAVPVINGLTERLHPCQLLADIQAFEERRGPIAGARVAWIGDGNNVCNSFIEAAEPFGFELVVACPDGFEPDADLLANAASVTRTDDPRAAVRGADAVVTDVWSSMGQEAEQAERAAKFADFQVTTDMMALANRDAAFLHCLPAHRGEEVQADVIDGPQSIVWSEAENRLHAQKALLEHLLVGLS